MANEHTTYWTMVKRRFLHHRIGVAAVIILILFCLVGIYAPFLAASKPLIVEYNNSWYFPLFRYLFFNGYYTKPVDLFFNLLIFTFPLFLLAFVLTKNRFRIAILSLLFVIQLSLSILFAEGFVKDPSSDPSLNKMRQAALTTAGKGFRPSWSFNLQYMNDYAKLNLLLQYQQRKFQHQRLQRYLASFNQHSKDTSITMPTLWQQNLNNESAQIKNLSKALSTLDPSSAAFLQANERKQYLVDRRQWLENESNNIKHEIMPLLSPFHWEDDAGGSQMLNRTVSFSDLTRINRKDLVAALIFGVRISLVVGITSIALALIIGVPIGAFSGFYGGKFDIIVCRLLEIWESMPAFFMLLMIVAVLQSKSLFLIITVIGLFGWTTFSRYARGEFFKQRNLAYVEACHSVGFTNRHIMFSHILPNAIPPILTLLPFAIMGAITSEAGLSFLGLGEEGSTSWGVLMDEGRSAFPGESYLLWPPAILLTILLIAIALVGDALRDALDPRMK